MVNFEKLDNIDKIYEYKNIVFSNNYHIKLLTEVPSKLLCLFVFYI